jgi:hypothetical protein
MYIMNTFYKSISSYNTDGDEILLNIKYVISYQDTVEGDKPEEHVDICHDALLVYQCTLKSILIHLVDQHMQKPSTSVKNSYK